MPRRRLVLFDIDGTLIRDHGAAREAYARALRAIYGRDRRLERYDFSGRTDPEITHMVLADLGIDAGEIERLMPLLWERYLVELQRLATAATIEALPGVAALLDRLADLPEVALGLLTGNIERGARIKLEPPDLNRYFPFGAFGSDSMRRDELAPIAVERASAIEGRRFSGDDIVIIGDSIFDVRCGVPHSATTIAVASGRTPADLLRAENPHHFFESLEEIDALVAAIVGPEG
ncbi:MAG TPA: HAD family hydrolase [Thermoanaerobaculia bacterium]|nr:HAD family hydrolase [Thermoanaerobaculia bacterium]